MLDVEQLAKICEFIRQERTVQYESRGIIKIVDLVWFIEKVVGESHVELLLH